MSKIGQILRKTREEKGLDIEEVYLKTKISPKILEALEEGGAQDLVDFIYARNFLKQYANFLGLNGEELSKDFASSCRQMPATDLQAIALQQPKKRKIKLPYSLILILSFVLIIAVISTVILVIIKNWRTKPEALKISSISVDDSLSSVAQEGKKLTLCITTNNDVWVKIEADGEEIIQTTLTKNSKEIWRADKNFKLSVGKPEAVRIELNGRPQIIPKGKKIRGTLIDKTGIHF